MQTRIKPIYVRGFALLEVFLSIMLLALITFGTFSVIQKYRNVGAMQPLVSDLSNIAIAYAPIQDTTALTFTSSLIRDDGSISAAFLQGVPIAASHFQASATDGYAYLLAGLNVNGQRSRVGFAQLETNGANGVPVLRYLVMGLVVSHDQLSQLVQDLNAGLGIFYGAQGTSLKSATLASGLPTCTDSSGCAYAVYLVSPKTERVDDFTNDFTAPNPQ